MSGTRVKELMAYIHGSVAEFPPAFVYASKAILGVESEEIQVK